MPTLPALPPRLTRPARLRRHLHHRLYRRLYGRLALLAGAALLAACANTPDWDRHFGEATRATLAQQVRHPDAVRNADPVDGMDGRAGRAAIDRYQKSFTEPAPQPAPFTIGVSSGK